jgi:hypothetical protein
MARSCRSISATINAPAFTSIRRRSAGGFGLML